MASKIDAFLRAQQQNNSAKVPSWVIEGIRAPIAVTVAIVKATERAIVEHPFNTGMLVLLLLGLWVVGDVLVLMREAFFDTIPWLQYWSPWLGYLFDLLAIAFEILFDAIVGVLQAINDAVEVVTDIDLHLGGISFMSIRAPFRADTIRDEMTYIKSACSNYDTGPSMVINAVKHAVGDGACATVRYLHPVPWLQRPTDGVVGWLYDGSAEPDASFDSPVTANCAVATNSDQVHMIPVCFALGIGFVVRDIAVPVFIVALLLVQYKSAVALLLYHAVQLVLAAARGVVALFTTLDNRLTSLL